MEFQRLLLEIAAIKGQSEEEYVRRGCRVTHGRLPSGEEYYTVSEGEDAAVVRLLAGIVEKFLPKELKRVMVVGLGNRGMTADALGNCVLSHMPAGGKDPHIGLIAPQVSLVTGVESADIVESLSARLKPELVVLTDTLATSRCERLGRCYQVGNFALRPGSGVGGAKKIEPGARTISLGVPLVIKLSDLGVRGAGDLTVTPADIDEKVERCGKNIAKALTLALCGGQRE